MSGIAYKSRRVSYTYMLVSDASESAQKLRHEGTATRGKCLVFSQALRKQSGLAQP
jgi:hypothetical protein